MVTSGLVMAAYPMLGSAWYGSTGSYLLPPTIKFPSLHPLTAYIVIMEKLIYDCTSSGGD